MDKLKKVWKEVSVFGIVLIVFLGLFVYNKIVYVNYTTISPNAVKEKMAAKDDFIVVVGSSADTTTLSYQSIMTQYIRDNRSKKLYFADVSGEANMNQYIRDTFDTEDGSVPQTFVIKDGKIASSQTGALNYYQLDRLYK